MLQNVLYFLAWTLGGLCAIALLIFMVLLVLLVREDLRAEVRLILNERARKRAKEEELFQEAIAAHHAWNRTIFHHGIDRETGQVITGVSTQPTAEALRLEQEMKRARDQWRY